LADFDITEVTKMGIFFEKLLFLATSEIWHNLATLTSISSCHYFDNATRKLNSKYRGRLLGSLLLW